MNLLLEMTFIIKVAASEGKGINFIPDIFLLCCCNASFKLVFHKHNTHIVYCTACTPIQCESKKMSCSSAEHGAVTHEMP